jgi:putative aldouronate transport system permease protein
VLARSLSDEAELIAGRVTIVPRGLDVTAYKLVMTDSTFWTNYRNTVFYTVTATLISIVLTTCYAYVLSKHHLKGAAFLVGIALFTLFFTGGLIPTTCW